MKNLFLTLILFFIISSVCSQTPQAINYQAIARDFAGNPISNQNVRIRISILQGSINGNVTFSETHLMSTNQFGLLNLQIGTGTILSGSFSNINWGASTFFVQVELDPAGGTNYQILGTTQMLSVPYALFAKRVESESQILSISGNTVSISNGNSITLPGGSGGNYIPSQQMQPLQGNTFLFKVVSANLGDLLILYSSNEIDIYKKDPITFQYYHLNKIILGDNITINSLTWINNTIYTIELFNSTVSCRRYSIDSAGKIIGQGTTMTPVGFQIQQKQMFIINQDIYIYNSGNTWNKVTISGNNLITNGIWNGGPNTEPYMVFYENGNVYMLDDNRNLTVVSTNGSILSSKNILNNFKAVSFSSPYKNPFGVLYFSPQVCFSVSQIQIDNDYHYILTPITIF